jgi:hypothetical protein
MSEIVTAGILVIGDEILSGRTKDKNIGFIAEYLTNIGIDLKEVRVVADDETDIVDALNALRNRYTYVFNNPLKYVDPSGYCATNTPDGRGGFKTDDSGELFNCELHELAGLNWEVRSWWLGELANRTEVDADWFNDIQHIVGFFGANPLTSNLTGWASWGDAAAVCDGIHSSRQHLQESGWCRSARAHV